jgi:hypothetical protein
VDGLVGTSQEIKPEKRLLVAMIQDAVQVFQRGPGNGRGDGGTRRRVEYREARDWLLGESDADGIGTLNWVCAHLDVEPGWIRREALRGRPLPRVPHFVSRDPSCKLRAVG